MKGGIGHLGQWLLTATKKVQRVGQGQKSTKEVFSVHEPWYSLNWLPTMIQSGFPYHNLTTLYPSLRSPVGLRPGNPAFSLEVDIRVQTQISRVKLQFRGKQSEPLSHPTQAQIDTQHKKWRSQQSITVLKWHNIFQQI